MNTRIHLIEMRNDYSKPWRTSPWIFGDVNTLFVLLIRHTKDVLGGWKTFLASFYTFQTQEMVIRLNIQEPKIDREGM